MPQVSKNGPRGMSLSSREQPLGKTTACPHVARKALESKAHGIPHVERKASGLGHGMPPCHEEGPRG